MVGAVRVRRALPEDVAELDAMIRELAEYEREPDAVEATPEDLAAALFGEHPRVFAHVAEVETDRGWEVAGSAVWFTTYSTWTGRHGTWLEDLYVRPQHRGGGIGRRLLAALAAEALASGHRRLEWTVLDWNTSAQAVYAAVGAGPQDEWTTWRITGAELERLAGSAQPPRG